MSNVSIENAFEGLDDAKAVDRYPKLPPNGDFILEVFRTELIDGFKSGTTFVIEHKVIKSSLPDVVVGGMYSTTITKLNEKANRELKLGKVKGFLASCLQIDAESKRPWMQLVGYFCKKQIAFGWRVRCQTGPRSVAQQSGKEYTPVMFLPAPAEFINPAQKELSAKIASAQ